MARVKYGDGVSGQSGSINRNAGGVTYSKNNVKRIRVIPTNPQSAMQSQNRNVFAFLTQAWSGLTQADRQTWEDAKALPYYSVIDGFYGTSRPVASGKSLFIQLNYNALESQDTLNSPQTIYESAPSPDSLASDVGGVVLTSDNGNETISMAYNGTLSGEVLIVRTTPAVSAGVMRATSVKSQFRTLGKYTGASPLNIKADFLAAHGATFPAAGSKIFFEVFAVNENTGKKRTVYAGSTITIV